jgi:hypothetical protein
MKQNDGAITDMYRRADQLGWDSKPLDVRQHFSSQAKSADRVDLILSLLDLSPTPGYNPGLAPLLNLIKLNTGVPGDKYLLDKLINAPAYDWNNSKHDFRNGVIR